MNTRRLHELLTSQARQRPDAIALWWQDQPITYAALQARVRRLAQRLAACGEPGDRVAILAWNCPEFVELIYAASLAGRILVPLNARLAVPELIYQLESAGVGQLFADPDLLEPLIAHPEYPENLAPVSLGPGYETWLAGGPLQDPPDEPADDAAWILFTSGSTGRPKGAVLTHSSFFAGLESAALGRPVEPNDIYLYPFPLFHVAAHNVLLQHQYGAAVALVKSFKAGETLRCCRELRVTTLSLAPTMIAMLLDHPDFTSEDLASVRTIGYGASAMPQTLLQRLLSTTSVGLCQSYGMTELSGSVSFLTVEDHQLAAGTYPELLQSVGKPLPTADIRLQHGEILVQARQCMREYWQDPEASEQTLEDGWLHTGDVGRFDDGGYLYIIDRKKDMIISGGENVASREVEEVLRQHPAVRECAVIGLPDSRWGETVCAVVQLKGEAEDEALDTHCREHLAAYKTPKRWHRIETMPVNAGGKIDKPRLRALMETRD